MTYAPDDRHSSQITQPPGLTPAPLVRFGLDRREAHRASVVAKLGRIAGLLEEWEEWDVDQTRPPQVRQLERPPISALSALKVLHRALLAELHDLDGGV